MHHLQGVSMQAMSIDCLNTAKHFCLSDCINTLESSSAQVRQTFSRYTQEHQTMADDWFKLMERRGWYQVPPARPESRTQMAGFINSLQSGISGQYTGAGTTQSTAGQYNYSQTYGGGSQYGWGQGGFGSQLYGRQSAAQQQGGMYSGASVSGQQYLK